MQGSEPRLEKPRGPSCFTSALEMKILKRNYCCWSTQFAKNQITIILTNASIVVLLLLRYQEQKTLALLPIKKYSLRVFTPVFSLK